jgi:hypothetical protein
MATYDVKKNGDKYVLKYGGQSISFDSVKEEGGQIIFSTSDGSKTLRIDRQTGVWLEGPKATTDRAQTLRLLGTPLIEYDYAEGQNAQSIQVLRDAQDNVVEISASSKDPSESFAVKKEGANQYKITFQNGTSFLVDQSSNQPGINVNTTTGEITVTYVDAGNSHHWIRYHANGTVEHQQGDPP